MVPEVGLRIAQPPVGCSAGECIKRYWDRRSEIRKQRWSIGGEGHDTSAGSIGLQSRQL